MQLIPPHLTDFTLPPADLLSRFVRDAFVICRDVLLPARSSEFREKALHIADRHARRIDQQSAEHPLRYRVVTGDVIATEWSELFTSYQSSELREWVAAVAGVSAIFPSSHLRSSININIMGEPGEVYRWHMDASGFTLVLYLSDSREENGGSLELRAPGATTTTTMVPAAGTVVLMDGTRCLHRVSPIVGRHERISIPMVFTLNPDERRPPGLDNYLYSTEQRNRRRRMRPCRSSTACTVLIAGARGHLLAIEEASSYLSLRKDVGTLQPGSFHRAFSAFGVRSQSVIDGGIPEAPRFRAHQVRRASFVVVLNEVLDA